MPRLTLIGHNYLGPGNKLDNGEPVNNADYIAQQHDIEYSKAKTKSDIFEADLRAIQSFQKDFVDSPNFSSAAGLIGLSIKHSVERLSNRILYPPLVGNYVR